MALVKEVSTSEFVGDGFELLEVHLSLVRFFSGPGVRVTHMFERFRP